MNLQKKIDEKTLISASYTTTGIILRVKKDGDRYHNAVAAVEVVDGKPRLTIFKDSVKHAGLTVKNEEINPKEW